MRAIELVGEVDDRHHLLIDLPDSVLPGKVRVIVLTPDAEEDDAGGAWMYGISQEWAEELRDPREDIYCLEDGDPVLGSR
jgi:hypothetical protein